MRKPSIVHLFVLVAAFLVPLPTHAQQKTEKPEFQLVQFHLGILKTGPKSGTLTTAEMEKLHQDHVAYVTSLLEAGKAMISGPLTDAGELRGIYIFRAQSAEEARSWAQADPAVTRGVLVVEMHPWWSEDVMKKASPPFKLTTYYLAFLRRGPKWTPEQTPQTEELQKAHFANVKRLAEMKKLVVAGPFGDDGELRGIFVFRCDSIQEAQALTATDPLVKAGRLAAELFGWQVPEGILP